MPIDVLHSPAAMQAEPRHAPAPAGSVRLAVVDADVAFLRVLERRMAALGWDYRVLDAAPPPAELVALRLNALVVDPAALGGEGWPFLERTCAALPELAFVVCTGTSSVAERVRALRLGVDDWIAKPAHPEEVVARVEAVVRRGRLAAPRPQTGAVLAGELEIRSDRFEAFAGGRPLGLTRREFELLWAMAQAHGRVVERHDLYQRVWGWTMPHGDRSVDVFVRKLRQKLERGSPGWTYIHTHFGVGYRFEPEPAGR
jgi:DNA-binding response OmpR family regulator